MRFARIVIGAAALFSLSATAADGFRLWSPDLPAGKPVADMFVANSFGCSGGNISPALNWSAPPAGTKSLAVTWFDPYRPPVSGWWHWVVYDLPADIRGLPRNAGAPGNVNMPAGAKQGLVDSDAPEPYYHGPCPDIGDPPHRYTITVYALSIDHVDLPATATAADVDYVLSTKALAKAVLVHPHARKK